MKNEDMSFETAIRRLEAVASELEKEGISLDESLKLYEEGIKLTRYCKEMLDGAQRKVNSLRLDGNGEVVESEFPSGGAEV